MKVYLVVHDADYEYMVYNVYLDREQAEAEAKERRLVVEEWETADKDDNQ